MRPWTRLQDWVTLLAGVYAMTSPLVLSTVGMSGEGKVVVAMITLGTQQGLQEPRGDSTLLASSHRRPVRTRRWFGS
jgi:hypothetical protein